MHCCLKYLAIKTAVYIVLATHIETFAQLQHSKCIARSDLNCFISKHCCYGNDLDVFLCQQHYDCLCIIYPRVAVDNHLLTRIRRHSPLYTKHQNNLRHAKPQIKPTLWIHLYSGIVYILHCHCIVLYKYSARKLTHFTEGTTVNTFRNRLDNIGCRQSCLLRIRSQQWHLFRSGPT